MLGQDAVQRGAVLLAVLFNKRFVVLQFPVQHILALAESRYLLLQLRNLAVNTTDLGLGLLLRLLQFCRGVLDQQFDLRHFGGRSGFLVLEVCCGFGDADLLVSDSLGLLVQAGLLLLLPLSYFLSQLVN